MRYTILHELPGRIRVHCLEKGITAESARAIGAVLSTQDGILSAVFSIRTRNLVVTYSRIAPRRHVLALLDVLEPADWEGFEEAAGPQPPSFFEMALAGVSCTMFWHFLKVLFLPIPVRYALTALEALPVVWKGAKSVGNGRLDIAVLDASALSVLAARRDFSAIRTILWMFSAADSLEEWTREQSRRDLAESLALRIDTVWVRTAGGEVAKPIAGVVPGDEVIIRTGSVIPVDGLVVEGEAMVNQSVLTGESLAVHKRVGLSVFAGTVLDEGSLVVRAEKAADDTRLQSIVSFIEESEALKAGVQSRAERMADGIVPYSLGLALAVLAVTRNPIRASAVLMVDYSCAIRMATPLTILTAISEGVKNGVLIKGGKHLETLAGADSLVLDKTGTLTCSRPSVARVVAFDGWTQKDVLRTAACIEEHFPHPVGRAVVRRADEEKLLHRERHAKPEYILAHGIVSRLDGKQIIVGSGHFVFDDLKIPRKPDADVLARAEAERGRSLLFLAYDGNLVGLLAIEDPIRDDAAATLGLLRQCGISDITMLTGDGQRTAAAVAAVLDIRDFHSGLLPVDKANLIKEMQRNGRTVVFVGDGVNDSPALSAAAVGVSLKDGSDIAREVAGVVLADGRLASLMTARMLSELAIRRVTRQFGFIMGVNSLLIFLGLFGAITPRVAALLHNLATVLVTANSVKGVLPNWLRGKVIEMPEDAAEAEQEDTGELGGEASSRPVTA